MADPPRPGNASKSRFGGNKLIIIFVIVALVLIAAAAIFIPLLASTAS